MSAKSMVQTAESADLDWICDLIFSAQERGEVWAGRWTSQQVRNSIESDRCLIVRPSGFLIFGRPGDAWEIELVAVSPTDRQTGVFRLLLEAIEDQARAIDAGRYVSVGEARGPFQLWLEVHEANSGAIEAYRRCGFFESGRRPRYYPDGGAAILMTKHCL